MKDRKRPVLRMILGTAWAVCVLCLQPGSLTAMAETAMAETAPTGIAPAESGAGSIDGAGLRLWEAAQERQRNLPELSASGEGSWSLECGGLKLERPFSGRMTMTGLGTEQMDGTITLISQEEETEILFRNGGVTMKQGGEETALTSDPRAWETVYREFADWTTYDLSLVRRLWVSGHEEDRADRSTVLSYELDGAAAASGLEPAVKGWLENLGIHISQDRGWLTLNQVEGELTIDSAGYMMTDRLRAEAAIPLGQKTASWVFEISITYDPPAGR